MANFFGKALGNFYRDSRGLLRVRSATLDGDRCGYLHRDSRGILKAHTLSGMTPDDCAVTGPIVRDENGVLRPCFPYSCDVTTEPCPECDSTPSTWTLLLFGALDFLGINNETDGCGVFCSHTDCLYAKFNGSYTLTRTNPTSCTWTLNQVVSGPWKKVYTHYVVDPGCPDHIGQPLCDSVSEGVCPCSCTRWKCISTCECCQGGVHCTSASCGGSFCCCRFEFRDGLPPNCQERQCCLNHYPPAGPPYSQSVDFVDGVVSASLQITTTSLGPSILFSLGLTLPHTGGLSATIPISAVNCLTGFGLGTFPVYETIRVSDGTGCFLICNMTAIVVPG